MTNDDIQQLLDETKLNVVQEVFEAELFAFARLVEQRAIDQLPDTTKMIEPSISIVGWMYEDQLPEIYPYEEMFPFSVVDGVRMFPVYAPKAEPDTGIDRGAWSDVPDATKWVDELRGDEPVAKVCHNLPQHIGWNPKITHLPDEGTPLYTAPQKREWVGLTDDEIFKADDMVPCHLPAYKRILMFGKILEVRLKEKNYERSIKNNDICGND